MTTSEEESNVGEDVDQPDESPCSWQDNCCVNFIKDNWKNFLSALFIGVLPSFFDFSTDTYSAYIYNNGTVYIKNVLSKNDSRIQNCTLVDNDEDTYEEKTHFKYECFEQDPNWCKTTIVFMFLPGLMTWGTVLLQVDLKTLLDDRNNPKDTQECGLLQILGNIMFKILLMVTFPIQLVVVKICSLFIYTEGMTDTNQMLTTSEGWWESSSQYCLQAFIMLTTYRRPSWIQYVTLVTSLCMITKTNIMDFLKTEVTDHQDISEEDPSEAPVQQNSLTWAQWTKDNLHSLKEAAVKPGKVFPMFLLNSIFKGGSITLILVLARYNSIWYFLIVGGSMHTALLLLKFCSRGSRFRHFLMGFIIHSMNLVQIESPASVECTCSPDTKDFTARQKKENLVFCNFLWFIIYSITLVCLNIIAFSCPDFEFQTFYPINPYLGKSYKLSDMPIVHHPFLLLVLSSVILVCGIISFTLICFQVESLRTVLKTFCEETQEPEIRLDELEAAPLAQNIEEQGDVNVIHPNGVELETVDVAGLEPEKIEATSREEQVELNMTDGVEVAGHESHA